MPRQKVYTEAQINILKARLNKTYQKELTQARVNWFERGKRSGKQETINIFRVILGLEPVYEEF